MLNDNNKTITNDSSLKEFLQDTGWWTICPYER